MQRYFGAQAFLRAWIFVVNTLRNFSNSNNGTSCSINNSNNGNEEEKV